MENFFERDKYVNAYHVISLKTYKELKDITNKKIYYSPFWVNEKIWFKLDNKDEIRNSYGFDKDDFKIELDNFNLSVSLEKGDNLDDTNHYNKREFNYSSFKRSFKLAKYSDIKKIDASYVKGILTIQIPKTKEAIPLPVKSIKVS